MEMKEKRRRMSRRTARKKWKKKGKMMSGCRGRKK